MSARLALVGYDFQAERLRAVVPRLPPCEVRLFDLRTPGYEASLEAWRPTVVLQYGTGTTDEPRDVLERRYALAPRLATTFFAENAWLPQAGHLYLDPRGLADESELAALDAASLDEPEEVLLDQALEAYRRRSLEQGPELGSQGPAGGEREGHVLVCLQVPDDTVIERASPVSDMQELVDRLEERMSGERLVVRPHPLDRRRYRARSAALRGDGPIGAWIRGARAVVACNSTTLLESLAWGVPALAFGRGVFSGKRAVVELDRLEETPATVREVLEAADVDPPAVRRFLWELVRRQIPLDAQGPDLTAHSPVLPRVRRALGCAT